MRNHQQRFAVKPMKSTSLNDIAKRYANDVLPESILTLIFSYISSSYTQSLMLRGTVSQLPLYNSFFDSYVGYFCDDEDISSCREEWGKLNGCNTENHTIEISKTSLARERIPYNQPPLYADVFNYSLYMPTPIPSTIKVYARTLREQGQAGTLTQKWYQDEALSGWINNIIDRGGIVNQPPPLFLYCSTLDKEEELVVIGKRESGFKTDCQKEYQYIVSLAEQRAQLLTSRHVKTYEPNPSFHSLPYLWNGKWIVMNNSMCTDNKLVPCVCIAALPPLLQWNTYSPLIDTPLLNKGKVWASPVPMGSHS